jgi:hypothetical protein
MNSQVLIAIAVLSAPNSLPQDSNPPASAALAAPVRLECDTGPIDTGAYVGHAGPLYADLDGDGRRELLVGNFKGHFQCYEDAGEPGKPKFVARGLLKAAGVDAHVENW